MKTFKIPCNKGLSFAFTTSNYAINNNTYVGLMCKEETEKYWQPFCDVTVNLSFVLEENQAFIDVNNNSSALIKFLEDEDFITSLNFKSRSGFVDFPLYNLNMEKINEYIYKEKQDVGHGGYDDA